MYALKSLLLTSLLLPVSTVLAQYDSYDLPGSLYARLAEADPYADADWNEYADDFDLLAARDELLSYLYERDADAGIVQGAENMWDSAKSQLGLGGDADSHGGGKGKQGGPAPGSAGAGKGKQDARKESPVRYSLTCSQPSCQSNCECDTSGTVNCPAYGPWTSSQATSMCRGNCHC